MGNSSPVPIERASAVAGYGGAQPGEHPEPAIGVRYVGVADWWGRRVWVEHGDVRSGLRYSSGAVIEFAWGRAGLGARELARSILHHANGGDDLHDVLYGCFVHDVIAALPESGFELDRREVLAWLALQR